MMGDKSAGAAAPLPPEQPEEAACLQYIAELSNELKS